MWVSRRGLLAGATAGTAAVVSGCGAGAQPAAAPVEHAPRNAAQLAVDSVSLRQPWLGARVQALFHVGPARGTRLVEASRAVFGVGYLVDGADLDLERDVLRVFTVSTDMVSWTSSIEAVHVFELRDGIGREAFDAILQSGRMRPERVPHELPCAHVDIGEARRLVALPRPDLLVVVAEDEVAGAASFASSGGLPLPRERETISALATRPSVDTVGFVVPATLLSATATVDVTATGARVRFRAVSTDPETAQLDATWLTDRVDQALTLDLGIGELKVLGPYTFVAEGRYVESVVLLTREEAEWALGMARAFMPGG